MYPNVKKFNGEDLYQSRHDQEYYDKSQVNYKTPPFTQELVNR